MPRVDINSAVASNYSGQPDFSINSEVTDGISEDGNTRWYNTDWQKYCLC